MKKQKPVLPLLKDYAAFIQKNFLKEFIQEVLINYKKSEVPLLQYFTHLSEEELLKAASHSLNEFLQQFVDERAIETAEISIEKWKANSIPGISREDVKASDLVLINHARKTVLLQFMDQYLPNTRDVYPLLKEIEDYYSFHTELAIQAFTEIKEDEVIQRENRLREAQTVAKIGNWEYNTVTKEVKWSDELYKIYSIDPSRSLRVDDVVKYILPEDLPKIEQSVRGNSSYTLEYRIKRADGEIRTLLEIGYSERNAEGQILYRGTTQDISLLKKIENELKENEKNFRLLAENSTDVISRHSLDSTILYISPSSLPVTGYTPEELSGKRAYDYYHPEDLEFMQENFQQVTEIPDSMIVSFRFKKKDGNYIWLEAIGKTMRDQHGNPVEIIATNRDVTARKESELKLQKNEALLSGILNSSIGGIQLYKAVRDQQGKIIDFEVVLANDTVLKRWGMTREEIKGKKLLALFPGVIANGIFEKYVQASEGEPLFFRQHYNSDGYDNWYQLAVMKYEDGLLVSSNDITAQIVAKEELRRSNTELEEKVKLRTEQLEKQNKELVKINNDLDNFIYTASHDLKSPISNLEGLLNMVSDESEGLITDTGKVVLPMVSQSLTRLKTVIRELTDIARIQKEADVDQEEISLKEFYQEVIFSCESEIKNYKGKLFSDFYKAPVIKFSKRNLRSIFFNLVSNALKYSDPAKEGVIEIKTEKDDNYIVLTISDNGLGIPEKQKEKVFTMFKRYHTHVEGSGVGLYIIKRIVENAGGKIELETEVGVGTTFKLFLPE